MAFNFDVINKHRDINNELKNSGLSYTYLTWKNILNTYSDILYSANSIHEGLYRLNSTPYYYLYYDKLLDLICFTKIIMDDSNSFIPYMILQTAEDDLRRDKVYVLLKKLIDDEILCKEITIRYNYTYSVSRNFPTYNIEIEDINFLTKLLSYNFDLKLLFKQVSSWDEEISVNKVTIITSSFRNDLSEDNVNDIVQVYKQCKKYNSNITFLPCINELYGNTTMCSNLTGAIKNPYFHLMSVIETSVNGYNKNIEKLLPYISYTEKLIYNNILQGNNYINYLGGYVLNASTYEYAITIVAMYIFQSINYYILKKVNEDKGIISRLADKYKRSGYKIANDIITYHDCLCYYYAQKCIQQNNLPIKYKK